MDEILSDPLLEGDHHLLLDDIMQLLNAELQWCYSEQGKNVVSKNFQTGFIEGLKQAKTLILTLARENQLEDPEFVGVELEPGMVAHINPDASEATREALRQMLIACGELDEDDTD